MASRDSRSPVVGQLRSSGGSVPNQLRQSQKNNISYADIRGEWEERKIPLLGPVKSLISQLRVGQDMTKVSLPSILLRPYSMIEEFGSRTLGHIPILYKSSSQTDPQERMLTVVTWILSTTRDENFNHKPFNSILGETHVARLNHSDTMTYFFGEQISHHPPVTAFIVTNQDHKIKVTGTYSFSIKFAPNTIFVTTEGRCEIHLGDEVYIMDKSLPDMIIKNSLIGKKAVAWTGKISISCPGTGWHADLEYHLSKDLVKYVEGTILCLERSTKGAQSLYIGGRCGGTIYKSFAPISPDKLQDDRDISKDDTTNGNGNGSYYGIGLLKTFMESTGLTPETKRVPKKSSHKKSKSVGNTSDTFDDVLIDFTDKSELVPEYPDLEKLPANSSRIVWKEVAEHIVNNDMDKADEAKLRVEESQRLQRSRELADSNGTPKPVHFTLDESSPLIVKANEETLLDLPLLFDS